MRLGDNLLHFTASFLQTSIIFSDTQVLNQFINQNSITDVQKIPQQLYQTLYLKATNNTNVKTNIKHNPKFNFCGVLYIYLISNFSTEFLALFHSELTAKNCHNNYQANCNLLCKPANNWHLFYLTTSNSSHVNKEVSELKPNSFIPANAIVFQLNTSRVFFLHRFRWQLLPLQVAASETTAITKDQFLHIRKWILLQTLNYNLATVHLISPYPSSGDVFVKLRMNHITRQELTTVAAALVSSYIVSKMNGSLDFHWKGKQNRFNFNWWIDAMRENPLSLSLPIGSTIDRRKSLEYSTLFDVSYIVFIVGLPRPVGHTFHFLLQPFQPLVWIYLLVKFLVGTIVGSLITYKTVINAFPNAFETTCKVATGLFAYLMDQSIALVNKTGTVATASVFSSRVFISGWILGSIVLNNLYRSSIVSFLIQPQLTIVPTTFEMLSGSNYLVEMDNFMAPGLENSVDLVLEKYKRPIRRYSAAKKNISRAVRTTKEKVRNFISHGKL